MDILMITPEAMPFARTGGLADSVTSLSSALVDKGHNVKILMPRYYGISKDILTQLEGPLGVPSELHEIWTAILFIWNFGLLENLFPFAPGRMAFGWIIQETFSR